VTALLDVERPADRRPPSAPADWRVVTAVARVEGRRLVRHPATLAGLAISTAVAVAYFRLYAPVLHRDVATLSVTAAPLAAGVLLAAHLATSRIHRDETSAITGATPVPPERRTLGLAVAVLWPAALALVWVAAALAVLATLGGIGTPHPADVLATPGFVLLAGAVGVALGRSLPEPAGPLLTLPILGIGLSQLAVARTTAVRLTPWADWFPFPSLGFIEIWPRAPWLHLAYVGALAGAAVGMAVLHDRRRIGTVALTIMSVATAAVAAGQLLSVWDDPAAIAAFERTQRDPAALLSCTQEPPVEVCAPPAYRPWSADLAAPARATLALLPAGDRPERIRIELSGGWPGVLIGSLPEAAYRRVATAAHDRPLPDGTILLPASRRADRPEVAIALETARTALDLGGTVASTGPGGVTLEASCTSQGQAREVVAFAIAVSADPLAQRSLEAELRERPYGWRGDGENRVWSDSFWFETVWHPTTAIVWSRSGATNGLRLAERLPDITVLHERWDHWTDAETSSDELLTAFGQEPLPTARELARAEGFDPGPELPTNSDTVTPPC
jgi:hypothetical protein